MALTEAHVAGITESWNIVFGNRSKAEKKSASVDLFMLMFIRTRTKEDPEGYQQYFSVLRGMSDDELWASKKLTAHAFTAMRYVDSLVDTLDDGEVLTELIVKSAKTHLYHHIEVKHFQGLAELWPEYMEKHLGRAMKPAEAEGWKLVWTVIIGAVEAEMKALTE